MNVVEKIKCPKCGTEIDVNTALSHEIEERLKVEFSAQSSKHLAEIEKLQLEKTEIEATVSKEKEKEYIQRLNTEIEKMRKELTKENEEGFKSLQKSLKEKSEQVIELNKTKAELERVRLEKDEIESRIMAAKDAEFAKKIKDALETQKAFLEAERERIKREAAEENDLKLAEMRKKLEDQTALAEEMKRKAEQGSMQLQGEVQELAIEDILKETFRFDVIESVPKGITGADVIQKVRNHIGNEAGVIAYESKRTKAFGKDWISKLKEDGGRVKADICVLVTDALPDDVERIGQKDGVWICTFTEFKGLALVLRDSILRVSEVYASQTNKGEKMQMLYDYLTGKEFSSQFKAILESFSDLQKGYLDERNRMEKIWKTREKQLEKILLNTNGFIGSIKGIAGSSLPEIALIEGNDTQNLLEDHDQKQG
ncbi:MAG: DUF2130 domain-containing protein [Spirochaetaceae bacterium]|jgi:hypothetical protein|nr:DUF2130 domain-containing protein [Spirochaetaceae bacterium]